MNRCDYDLYLDGTGNAGKNFTGLASAVADTPTGTYGGIPRATFTFWANQYYSGATNGGAAVSAANIQQYMTSLALSCVRGNNMPDLWIGDSTYYKWKQSYGGLDMNQLKRMKELEAENARLKKMYSELSLLHHAMEEVVLKKR